ncbi:MAG: Holliday junction resolvase RuvX [bacterium]|nr:Holliday junction resolvase RuvX [Candidatus Sumerlaeota bacterium]
MGLDVGDARIGAAVSDDTRLIARPLAIVKRADGDPAGRIIAMIRELRAGAVVVGFPLNMDGTRGLQARKTESFVSRLREMASAAADIEFILWDERLSSREAQRIVLSSGAKKSRRARHHDDIAAAVILQSYLNHLRASPPRPDSCL